MSEQTASLGSTRHLAIVGPTASGKSRLAFELASAIDGAEIISLDSMQVYRGFDIGTAKPDLGERARVRHHLIDVADSHEVWSVRATQEGAHSAITEIEARGGRAIFVGGTGLYVQAVIDGFVIPPEDVEVRERIEQELVTDEAVAAAYRRLVALDPDAALRIEPTNRRRIVRALEVIELTDQPFSQNGGGIKRYENPIFDVAIIGLDDPDTLDARIEGRLEDMLQKGWLTEVEQLLGAEWSPTAQAAIGYRELAAVCRGERVLAEAQGAIALRTRQFARRQRRWFRRDPRVVWADPSKLPHLTAQILARWT